MIVSFEELVQGKVDGFEGMGAVRWDYGGAVDVTDITAIGQFCPATRFGEAGFSIRFKSSERMVVESRDTTAVRKLHTALTNFWLNVASYDARVKQECL